MGQDRQKSVWRVLDAFVDWRIPRYLRLHHSGNDQDLFEHVKPCSVVLTLIFRPLSAQFQILPCYLVAFALP